MSVHMVICAGFYER